MTTDDRKDAQDRLEKNGMTSPRDQRDLIRQEIRGIPKTAPEEQEKNPEPRQNGSRIFPRKGAAS